MPMVFAVCRLRIRRVREISSADSIEFDKIYNANGWELIFSKRPEDLLPVIKHALYVHD